jgi:hypothetical protein
VSRRRFNLLPCCERRRLVNPVYEGVRRLNEMVVNLVGEHQSDYSTTPLQGSTQCVMDLRTGIYYDVDWALFWIAVDRGDIPEVNPMEALAMAASDTRGLEAGPAGHEH